MDCGALETSRQKPAIRECEMELRLAGTVNRHFLIPEKPNEPKVESMEHDIDPDEGYRDTDWDSHLREPFYTEALPCESCGKPCDCERHPASYEPSLLVGPCCQVEEVETPDEPVCPRLYMALMFSDSVRANRARLETAQSNLPGLPKARSGAGKEGRVMQNLFSFFTGLYLAWLAVVMLLSLGWLVRRIVRSVRGRS